MRNCRAHQRQAQVGPTSRKENEVHLLDPPQRLVQRHVPHPPHSRHAAIGLHVRQEAVDQVGVPAAIGGGQGVARHAHARGRQGRPRCLQLGRPRRLFWGRPRRLRRRRPCLVLWELPRWQPRWLGRAKRPPQHPLPLLPPILPTTQPLAPPRLYCRRPPSLPARPARRLVAGELTAQQRPPSRSPPPPPPPPQPSPQPPGGPRCRSAAGPPRPSLRLRLL